MKETLLPYHFPVHYIELNDGELAYIKEGKGKEVILFVHGLSSNADAWYRNIEELKKSYTCIAVDLPGYGRSFKNAEAFTATYFSSIIKELTDKLKVRKFTLVGHSMGGQAAMKFASLWPEKLNGLILVAPAGIEEFTDFEGTAMKLVMNAATVIKTPEEQIERNYELNFFRIPPEAQQMITDRKNIIHAADFDRHAAAIEKSVAGMLEDKVIADLPKIRTPTLILFAENDQLIPNRYFHPQLTVTDLIETAEKNIKESKVVLIGEAGHFLQFEKPHEVNTAIRDFMKYK